MTPLETKAAAMYHAAAPCAPRWEQLGEVTKGLWLDSAAKVKPQPQPKAAPASRFAKYVK